MLGAARRKVNETHFGVLDSLKFGGCLPFAASRVPIVLLKYRRTAELLRVLFDAGYAFALETDENGFRRGLAVNPVLNFVAVGVAFANFVFRFADGGDEFFAIHADGRAALLNGFFHFGRERVGPLHGSRALLGKIEKRSEQLLQVVGREVRNGLGEFQKNGAAHAGPNSGGTILLLRSGR